MRAFSLARFLPFTPLIVVATACLLLEEEYPFSHFPMYSRFSDGTYYVYLANGDGQPLASYATVGISTGTLKKIYDTELRREARSLRSTMRRMTDDNKRAVAERVLARFRSSEAAGSIGNLPDVLRLYEVQIRLTDAQLRKETQLVAEVR